MRPRGRAAPNAGSVNATVGVAAPGSSLNVVYLRGGREATTALAVEPPVEAPVQVGADRVLAYGATLRDMEGEVQVSAVEAGTPAAQGGLLAGDLVLAVDGVATADIRAAARALEAAAGSVALEVRRGGDTQTITLEKTPREKTAEEKTPA
ncbi:MAG: PDZ domain-containing protein [Pseudomonadota bacterium]|nr:PDZ domain-containing protein [Pseudomonadota bacterium]